MRMADGGSAAVLGAIARAAVLPSAESLAENGISAATATAWSNNWADWDNGPDHNNWDNWAPEPPPGGK